jgi:hypothetical protein
MRQSSSSETWLLLVGQEILRFNTLEVTYLIYRRGKRKGSRRPISTSLIA